ncbi:MAG: FadR/GntR family transcriptional regulator [Synergistales bacterium]
MEGTESREKESKKKIVQDKLLELIRGGGYSYGDRLPSERDLAQSLTVSRNILREAVAALNLMGVVEIRERQGTFVRDIEEGNLQQGIQSLQILPSDFILMQVEVRLIISVPAAELAAMRRTDDDLRKLWGCFEAFSTCPYETPEDQAQQGKWESLLHHLVTEAAHNPLLSRLNEGIDVLVERNNALMHPYNLREAGWIDHITDQHRRIIEAIEGRNHKEAGSILREHLVEAVTLLLGKHPELKSNLANPYWEL